MGSLSAVRLSEHLTYLTTVVCCMHLCVHQVQLTDWLIVPYISEVDLIGLKANSCGSKPTFMKNDGRRNVANELANTLLANGPIPNKRLYSFRVQMILFHLLGLRKRSVSFCFLSTRGIR